MSRDFGLYGIDWDLFIGIPLALFILLSLLVGRVQAERRRVQRAHDKRREDFGVALALEEMRFRAGLRAEYRREDAAAAVDAFLRLRAERA